MSGIIRTVCPVVLYTSHSDTKSKQYFTYSASVQVSMRNQTEWRILTHMSQKVRCKWTPSLGEIVSLNLDYLSAKNKLWKSVQSFKSCLWQATLLLHLLELQRGWLAEFIHLLLHEGCCNPHAAHGWPPESKSTTLPLVMHRERHSHNTCEMHWAKNRFLLPPLCLKSIRVTEAAPWKV